MKLRKWVKVVIAMLSVMLFIALLNVDVNLPFAGKLFYGTIITLCFNAFAYMEY